MGLAHDQPFAALRRLSVNRPTPINHVCECGRGYVLHPARSWMELTRSDVKPTVPKSRARCCHSCRHEGIAAEVLCGTPQLPFLTPLFNYTRPPPCTISPSSQMKK